MVPVSISMEGHTEVIYITPKYLCSASSKVIQPVRLWRMIVADYIYIFNQNILFLFIAVLTMDIL